MRLMSRSNPSRVIICLMFWETLGTKRQEPSSKGLTFMITTLSDPWQASLFSFIRISRGDTLLKWNCSGSNAGLTCCISWGRRRLVARSGFNFVKRKLKKVDKMYLNHNWQLKRIHLSNKPVFPRHFFSLEVQSVPTNSRFHSFIPSTHQFLIKGTWRSDWTIADSIWVWDGKHQVIHFETKFHFYLQFFTWICQHVITWRCNDVSSVC